MAFVANPTIAIPTDNALQVSVYIPDTEGPVIVSYTLNLQDDILQLTFNEPVLVSTLNFTGISLSSMANGTAGVVLSGGQLLPPGNEDGVLIVVIQLTDKDVSQLKLDPLDIFTTFDLSEVFLSVETDTIQDFADNGNLQLVGIPATTIVTDQSQAVATGFSFDMNIGILDITFSDVMPAPSARMP